ncbi:hypothetical protein V0M98_34565 (plasmid) [Pseudomonas silesiensis]|uniref:hypothetical protein n=1 Tax=Pseudomonas silesiensis TaxID=1853130 RepID=UPI0030D5CD6B
MLEHYLTVVQLKKVYINPARPSIEVIHDGLHPGDALRYGLEPLLSVMITVAGHSIYHQQLSPMDKPICLISFLANAWQNLPKLGGVPEILTVTPELFNDYPLAAALSEIDPELTVKVVPLRNQSLAASLRHAQNNAESLIHDYKTTPVTVTDILSVVNLHLGAYKKYFYGTEVPVVSHKPYTLKPMKPSDSVYPMTFDGVMNNQWVSTAAHKIKRLGPGVGLFYYAEEPSWLNCLVIRKLENSLSALNPINGVNDAFDGKNDPQDDYFLKDMRTPGHIWVDEETGLTESLRTLAYDTDDLLREVIDSSDLEDYLKGRRPMIWALYAEIKDLIYNTPAIVIADKPAQVQEFTGYMNISEAFELTAINSEELEYRLFAMVADNDTRFLMAIKKSTSANSKNLESKFMNYDGKINIGVAGLAALIYFVKRTNKQAHSTLGRIAVDMMDTMLSHFSGWPED